MPAESSIIRSSTYGELYFYDQAHARAPVFALNFDQAHATYDQHMAPPVVTSVVNSNDFCPAFAKFQPNLASPRLRIFLNSQKNCWVRGFRSLRAIAAAV